MSPEAAPRGVRLHVGFVGRRNAGKSSVLNALLGQQAALVSPTPGTTTDPVVRAAEFPGLGPVLFVDTAGLDDEGALGEQRVARTRRSIARLDIAVIVAEAAEFGAFEESLVLDLRRRGVPAVIALNKTDLAPVPASVNERVRQLAVPAVPIAALTGEGIEALREAIRCAAPRADLGPDSLLGDLVGPGDVVVLVVPIDKEAPKGRLILPQVQAIRDLLDADALALVVKERELRLALAKLAGPPKLVVTDSQAFLKVAADVPDSVAMTSFSILLARMKGDLATQVEGALAIDALRPGDGVLIAESCSHHPIAEDIGRVKIPRWLANYAGGALDIAHVQGHDFPDDLERFKLVVHCGACMTNRAEVQARIRECRSVGVPVTNYGIAIAKSLGILERALSPFPAAQEALRAAERRRAARPAESGGDS